MRGIRSTHTFAELEVSSETFKEIANKLREAEYSHAFVDGAIDMHGIGLTSAKDLFPSAYLTKNDHVRLVICNIPNARWTEGMSENLKLVRGLRMEVDEGWREASCGESRSNWQTVFTVPLYDLVHAAESLPDYEFDEKRRKHDFAPVGSVKLFP